MSSQSDGGWPPFPVAAAVPMTVRSAWDGCEAPDGRPLRGKNARIARLIPPGGSNGGGKYSSRIGLGTYAFSMCRLAWDRPSFTVTASDRQMLLHPDADCKLTARQIARIGSFPDDFLWSRSQSIARQVGNSVPPALMRAVAECVRDNVLRKDGFTYMSVFAGCGGSSLGYKQAGGVGLAAVEFDAAAAETYRLNFPGVPVVERDVREVTAEELLEVAGIGPGELDILDGSPPCQGFSTAGKREMGDARNDLSWEFARLIEGMQPRAFVMENVSGLVKGKMRLMFREIMLRLKATGYAVKCKLLNAKWFGVPQSRERLIWVGVRPDVRAEPSHPRAQRRPVSLRTVCSDVMASRSMDVNPWIPSNRPCCTLTRTPYRRLFLLADKMTREPTEMELKMIGSFPAEFRFQNKFYAWRQIGDSVPPKFMEAVARHVAGLLAQESET